MCNTAGSGRRTRSPGQGRVSGGWVSGTLNTPTHPWEPPDLCKVGGSPILGVVEAGHLPGCVIWVGDTRGYGSCCSLALRGNVGWVG